MLGFAGKILHVNLTNGKIWSEDLSYDMVSNFIGGRGINAKLLWDFVKNPNIDPLSLDNVLIFGTGTLTCTTAPSSGRTTITTKSPLTNLYLKSSVGGHWGAELKFSGFDHLVIHGSSEVPVYVWIKNENVEVRDASHIWGSDVRKTDNTIKKELKDENVRTACVGPAGENLVKCASIMCSVYNAAARGGVGAVMGSKKLKAVAVRGTGEVEVDRPERFNKIALETREAALMDLYGRKLSMYGTGSDVLTNSVLSCNFTKGSLDGSQQILPPWYIKRGYWKRWVGCFSCSISCHKHTEIEKGLYAGTSTCGPEYESYIAIGSQCGIASPEVVIKANDLCNILGLDTISTGDAIAWLMESYEKGFLIDRDTDGLKLEFGNEEALLKCIHHIAYRKGRIGKLVSDGLRIATQQLGKESYKWAMFNSKGLEQSMMDVRTNKYYALCFAVNPRGPDHLHTEALAPFGKYLKMREVTERITGQKYPEALSDEYVPEVVRWHEDIYAVSDSLGICAFLCTAGLALDEYIMADLFSTATGTKKTPEEIMLDGRRILTLERCFNVRQGLDRKLDDLPWRMMNEPVPWIGKGEEGIHRDVHGELPHAPGMVVSYEWLNEMLDRYYSLHGWDQVTGIPKEETLKMLHLMDAAEELKKTGKLP